MKKWSKRKTAGIIVGVGGIVMLLWSPVIGIDCILAGIVITIEYKSIRKSQRISNTRNTS